VRLQWSRSPTSLPPAEAAIITLPSAMPVVANAYVFARCSEKQKNRFSSRRAVDDDVHRHDHGNAMIATVLCGTTNRSMPRMTVYLVAQLRFVDRPAYDRYQARFMDVFKQSEGRLLVADESPRVVEGSWDREKLVIMSFPSETSAREFLTSKEYEEIAKDRKAGADTLALLAREVSGG
jgi:uncharacterized protein (DUF1330 family)